ncbi:sporulation histidine kinase inhibitor Sda [Marinicrinis lubricantis]|uniref:Sporulation histidine kinase inhibitor Sda n=1 Tax=Marinicrinis lubricantis TaxID=2086470 RepID=A0ABW1IKY4_9BACL
MSSSMLKLNDQLLIETYELAVQVKCEKAFIQLLLDEIKRRGIALHPSFKWSESDEVREHQIEYRASR